MQKRSLNSLVLSIVLGCCVSGWLSASFAQSDDHLITNVQGKVSVKRIRRSNFVAAYIGMSVGTGDKFRMDQPDSKAEITCADGSKRLFDHSPFELQCPSVAPGSRPVIPPTHNGKRVSRVRGGPSSDAFPVLVSPRMTNLLNPYPLIKWLPVKDAVGYKVSVYTGADEIWTVHVGNVTEVQYTKDPAKALIPGKSYRVVVSTGEDCGLSARCSSEEKMANLGFSVLAPQGVQQVREAEGRIRNLHLPEIPTRLLVASLYSGWIVPDTKDGKALAAEAIELLEDIPNAQEPAVVRRLAELYVSIGLNNKGEVLYEHALDLSTKAGDVEGQALAQHALGQIFAKIRLNQDEALQRFKAAKALYESAGDPDLVAQIDQEIKELAGSTTLPRR